MKYISKQDEEDLQPYYINMKLAYQKGLSDGINVNDKYFELYSIYYNYLEKYLNDIINITDYEKKLDSMGFRGVIDDDKTKALIDRKHELNLFKLQLMPSFEFDPNPAD